MYFYEVLFLSTIAKESRFFLVSPEYFLQEKFKTGRHELKLRNFQTVQKLMLVFYSCDYWFQH